ncbi:unnamed protein product [Haemonchus placei]|uniref:ArsR family transcriptional regulator n=1 Tax=Haemonchus placei TaxID=6290 RepID=A0A0N4WED7_HAEPC|nr:unnamed protein product [Haemonchus placei]
MSPSHLSEKDFHQAMLRRLKPGSCHKCLERLTEISILEAKRETYIRKGWNRKHWRRSTRSTLLTIPPTMKVRMDLPRRSTPRAAAKRVLTERLDIDENRLE